MSFILTRNSPHGRPQLASTSCGKDSLYIYLDNLAARAITILLALFVPQEVLDVD